MDNYSDRYEVLIELDIGYLKSYVTMISWQLTQQKHQNSLTVSWFRYEEKQCCLRTFYVPQVLDDDHFA